MQTYVQRRILLAIITLLLVTFVIALLMQSLPGDIIDILSAEAFYNEVEKERLAEQLGIDDDFFTSYGKWLFNAVQGDFGDSLRTRRSIFDELIVRIPVTIELAVLGLLITSTLAIPLGILAAVKRNTWIDYLARSVAVFALAVPGFWIASLIVVFGAIWIGWSPPLGYRQIWEDPLKNLSQMWMPALLFGLGFLGVQTRILRTGILEVMREDYIRTAQAKGLSQRVVLFRHALRNALVPLITVVGVQFPAILGGSVIFESIFSLPGVGQFLINGVSNRDYTAVQAINVWIAAVVIGVNLIVDLSYAFIDPRIRLA